MNWKKAVLFLAICGCIANSVNLLWIWLIAHNYVTCIAVNVIGEYGIELIWFLFFTITGIIGLRYLIKDD